MKSTNLSIFNKISLYNLNLIAKHANCSILKYIVKSAGNNKKNAIATHYSCTDDMNKDKKIDNIT